MSSPATKTASQIRQDLLDIVKRDLLGPAGGPNEEVDETRVRDRYLTGMLAPRKQELVPEPVEVDPSEQDELAVAGAGTSEDGTPERGATATPTLFPSSFGFSFCVATTATAIRVEARWGQYLREQSLYATGKDGAPKLVWRRYPRGRVLAPIPLAAGAIPAVMIDSECPEVVLRGQIRKYDDHWSVTLFLVNNQIEPKKLRDQAWVFQPEVTVTSADGSPIFEKRQAVQSLTSTEADEAEALAMLYRGRLEYAVGHGVSVHADVDPESGRATAISTRVMPEATVPQSTSPTERDFPKLAGLELRIGALGSTQQTDMRGKLEPLVVAYRAWIDERRSEAATPELAPFRKAADKAVANCEETLRRLEDGIALLETNGQAAEAFRFANRAMDLQRRRSLLADAARRGERLDAATIDPPSWRVFQLAFILINLRGLAEPTHHDRNDIADLLWFPTGGGKTEAYLGLAAYTLAIRRLQGTVGGRDGEDGLAVLVRYTLRLLTLQQFQRAAALICACEALRREANGRLGATPFRLGLWVGQKTTPNTNEQADEALKSVRGGRGARGGVGSPYQLTYCPWCGNKIDPGRDIEVRKAPSDVGRTLTFCGDSTGRCLFTRSKSPDEGLPVVVVDEDVYRQLPSMMIATVDKFAQMPWNGRVGMLFGQVNSKCERHGYRCPDVEDESRHVAGKLPAAKTVEVNPLRPPDLIIQDELHLISGPLGSLVGLYETAVDDLCTWTLDGHPVRPKVIASTATVRRAADQVHAVFRRHVNVFPPHGLDVENSFFAVERDANDATPGRLYIGICAPGRRLKVAMIRVYVALLAAAQEQWEKHGVAADPWMTLVGYFNSMLELSGMRRLVDDDVRSRVSRADVRGLRKRTIRIGAVQELTSRITATDIPAVLDRMGMKFDPKLDAVREQLKKEKKYDQIPPQPLDVILATNMVSVGVDVPRLGVMAVAGQPKTTAEYIQATSRVGRSQPGLVCTVYNWARPRDLSHYETFEHYHSTFYKHVEALSVTPFSSGALSRGLTALLASEVRLRGSEFNANARAGAVTSQHPYVDDAVRRIRERAGDVASVDTADQVRAELMERVDAWEAKAQSMIGGAKLGYREQGVNTLGLLRKPSADPWEQFTCLNSLRDVEPPVNLILMDGKLDPPAAAPLAVVDAADAEEQ